MSSELFTSGGNSFISAMASVANSNMQLAQLKNSAGTVQTAKDRGDAKAAAQEFESLFLGQLLKLMFDTVPVSENFGGGFAEQTYKSLLIDQYGEGISKSGGIGIAGKLQQSLADFNNIDFEANGVVSAANQATSAYTKIYNF